MLKAAKERVRMLSRSRTTVCVCQLKGRHEERRLTEYDKSQQQEGVTDKLRDLGRIHGWRGNEWGQRRGVCGHKGEEGVVG